jgi:hypothetical protein
MSILLRITIQASARAAANILNYIEEVVEDRTNTGEVTVESVEPVAVPIKHRSPRRAAGPLPSGRTVAEARSADAGPQARNRQAPGTDLNPFVAQAVESSTSVHARVATPIHVPGRNRVIYMLTSPAPEGAVIFGQPRQVLDLLAIHPAGLSAKEVETISRLKQKSVESALHSLRVQGVIHSVEV